MDDDQRVEDGPAAEDLQFERAEYDAQPGAEPGVDAGAEMGAGGCPVCQQPLGDEYFRVNEAAVCRSCTEGMQQHLAQATTSKRVIGALMFGVPAAIAGSLIYYAILAITGYEIGLVAIVIGFMVGAAVRKGTHNLGGRGFQFLAAGLTYIAIVTTYVPYILEGLAEADTTTEAAAQDGTEDANNPEASEDGVVAAGTAGDPSAEELPPTTFGEFVLGITLLIGITLISPFLAGVENIIGLLIIGFGVYQAWKMNRRIELEISGPHRAAPQPDTA